MDWQGQKVAEQLMQHLLLGSALLALIAGYFTASYSTMLVIYLAGVVATLVAAVPNWPCFNRQPLHWLEPMYADVASVRQQKSKQQQVSAKKGVSKSQANKR